MVVRSPGEGVAVVPTTPLVAERRPESEPMVRFPVLRLVVVAFVATKLVLKAFVVVALVEVLFVVVRPVRVARVPKRFVMVP